MRSKEEHLVYDIWRHGFKPPTFVYPWQWADRERTLTTVTSGEPGPYRTARTPFNREIMEAMSPKVFDKDKGYWTLNPNKCVVVMKGSQMGVTDDLLNCIGSGVVQYPGPDYIVHPTVENGKRWSKLKLDQMITNTPSLRALIKDSRTRDSGNEIMMKQYPGGFLGIVGSNSPAGFRQVSLRRIYCDDYDGFALEAGIEGSPEELIANRQSTFADAMMILVSTPTDEETSNIWRAYQLTDQRLLFVPCLKCGEYEPISWGHIKWPQGEPLKAYLECLHCGFHMQNHHKNEFLPRGKWRPTAEPTLPGWVGYYLPGWYAPHGWESWGDIAVKFLRAKGDQARLRVWTNTKEGKPFKGDGEELKPDTMLERREDYTPEQFPDGPHTLVCSIDVQADRLEVQTDGYGRDKEYWNIDYHRIFGDPSVLDLRDDPNNMNVWKLALDVIKKPYRHPRFGEMRVLATCVDTGGDNTMKAYEFCRTAKAPNIWAIKGKDGKRPVWPRKASKRNKGKVNLYLVGVDTAKSMIYENSKIDTPGPSYRHYPVARDPEYFEQLFAERKKTYYSKGFPIQYWFLPSGKRNEALDLSAYSEAAIEGLISAGLDLNKRADLFDQRFPPGTKQTVPSHPRPRRRRGAISSGV